MATTHRVKKFQKEVWQHYRECGRVLPWRTTISPYRVFVSEIMLQQTQVDRVIPKFKEFVKKFPSFSALAREPQAEVLSVWSGLGYNRRALFLHKAAKTIDKEFNGTLPKDSESLLSLPGIGVYTAGAIQTFAYNIPAVFIETNIRSAYLHFFFKNKEGIGDTDLLPLVGETLDKKYPREWYFALMDYGAWVKKEYGNPNVRSRQYVKQSVFKGSKRESRGAILRELVAGKEMERNLLKKVTLVHAREALNDLIEEGFIQKEGEFISLT